MNKYILGFFSFTISLFSIAQTQKSAETSQFLNKVESISLPDLVSHDWIQKNLKSLPIYQVNGQFCLSTVAMVSSDFSKSDLDGQAYIGSQIGNIATIKIPLQNVTANQEFKNVTILKVAERISPHNDRMTADLRADSVWAGIGLDQPYTGKNVLIGITDWGFDYDHPMFMDTTLTTSRVRAAWDQFKIEGDQPAGMNYGVEYDTPVELDDANSDTAGTYYDYATHGSHVAGIAGGSGAGLKYRGVAFESEYLFNSIQLDEGSAIDAFNWMKTIADADGKRLVINMSWGLYYLGTMDGTSMISQAIESLSLQGVVFVTSAGNNGNVNLHLKKEFASDSLRSKIQIYGYNLHAEMWGQSVSMWGEPSKSFGARFEVYNGSNQLIGQSEDFYTDLDAGYHDTIMVLGTDTVFYNYTIDDVHPLNSRPQMRLRVKNTNTSYSVVLNSFATDGTVHYWNVVELSNGVGNWGQSFTAYGANGVSGNSEYSVGEPACTEAAITVASHGPEVVNGAGTQYPGSSSGFSSHGPTYDERMKPDVSAPGSGIVSSINSYTTRSYSTSASTTFNGRTYDFSAFSGTSMSSPATAGVVALMLEANPNLTTLQVKDILKITAREDNKTGVIPVNGSPEWGWGKVTATNAVFMAQNTVSISENETNETFLNVYPNPVKNELNLVVQDPGKLTNFEIYSLEGKLIVSGLISHNERIDVSNWSNGIYLIRVKDSSNYSTAKFIKQ